MWNDLFSSVNLLEKGLGATWLRNEVISNNIANVDTPGFKASEVEFETLMADALAMNGGRPPLKTSHDRHIAGQANGPDSVQAAVVTNSSTSAGMDENNVDIESEMVALAKNSIEYYTLINKVNSEFRKLDAAIHVT